MSTATAATGAGTATRAVTAGKTMTAGIAGAANGIATATEGQGQNSAGQSVMTRPTKLIMNSAERSPGMPMA
jgi:hypothetical protein